MAKIYYRQIKNKNNNFIIENVPELWREAVKKLIAEDVKKDV